MHPAVLNVAVVHEGFGEKVTHATVPEVVGDTLDNARPPAV